MTTTLPTGTVVGALGDHRGGKMIAAAPAVDVAALYAAHRLSLVRMAVLLVDDATQAEDIVQDAFVGLHRRLDRGAAPESVIAYLRTSVLNGARSGLRKRRTVRLFLARAHTPDHAPSADLAALQAETGSEVIAAVQALPSRMREVLVLRFWCDLTERQIADLLGISTGTVKSTASRALDKLESTLGATR